MSPLATLPLTSHPSDQLITLVAQKTGISDDLVRQAVETVIGHLKDKLPAPLAGQLDSVLSGQGLTAQGLGQIGANLGGMLGKR